MAAKFILDGGSIPLCIPYNIKDEELYPLLDSMNGIFFTGGNLDLYEEESNTPHQYTVTAMKIFAYSKKQNDQGNPFPIMGVCQGYELMHIL